MDQTVPLDAEERAVVRPMVRYLVEALRFPAPLHVRRFSGGRANLTFSVRAGRHDVVVRRPPLGEVPPGAHDMVREHRVMSALSAVLAFVPRPLHLCTDVRVWGAPFFLMERRHGYMLGERWPDRLPRSPDSRAAAADALLEAIADLHSVDANAVGLASLGRPHGYLRRQVRGWAARWESTAGPQVGAVRDVLGWLDRRSHLVPERAGAVVHNDLKLANVMFEPGTPPRIAAIFDWDMSTLGDPLTDLGLLLAYWGEPGDDVEQFGGGPPLTALPGFPSRTWMAERYRTLTGRDVSDIGFYRILGLAKIAVLLQQLLRRDREDGRLDRVREYERRIPAIWEQAWQETTSA